MVGGYAVAFYGYPRFTKDLDIFYDESWTNVEKLRSALVEFGFGAADIPPSLFAPGSILNFGIEPVRIDLLNRIDGVDFQEARTRSVRGKYGKVQVSFIGLTELKRNKKSTGRIQDVADLEILGDS